MVQSPLSAGEITELVSFFHGKTTTFGSTPGPSSEALHQLQRGTPHRWQLLPLEGLPGRVHGHRSDVAAMNGGTKLR